MSEGSPELVPERVDAIYHSDSSRILATLIRLLGDFELAEEALQEAFAAALAQRIVRAKAKIREAHSL